VDDPTPPPVTRKGAPTREHDRVSQAHRVSNAYPARDTHLLGPAR
jgi:hypothetical protein